MSKFDTIVCKVLHHMNEYLSALNIAGLRCEIVIVPSEFGISLHIDGCAALRELLTKIDDALSETLHLYYAQDSIKKWLENSGSDRVKDLYSNDWAGHARRVYMVDDKIRMSTYNSGDLYHVCFSSEEVDCINLAREILEFD